MIKLIPDPPHTLEENLIRISDILRCASAVAYEAGDHLSGSKRSLALAVVYMIDMARALVDQSIVELEARSKTVKA
jgi:hypothetical protein